MWQPMQREQIYQISTKAMWMEEESVWLRWWCKSVAGATAGDYTQSGITLHDSRDIA